MKVPPLNRIACCRLAAILLLFCLADFVRADSNPSIRFANGDVQEIGRGGHPQPYYHVRGSVSSPKNIASVQFRIGDGPIRIVSIGMSESEESARGEFRIAVLRSKLGDGINRLTVQCLYRDGTTARREIVLVKHRMEPVRNDTSQPTVINWPAVSRISDVGEVVTGEWQKTKAGIHTHGGNLAIGNESWIHQDRDIEVVLSFQKGENTGPDPAIVIRTGWVGIDQDGTDVGSRSIFQLVPESTQPMRCRHRVERLPRRGFRIRSKYWMASAEEPDAWQIDQAKKNKDSPPGSVSISVTDMHVTLTETTIRFLPPK